MHYNGVITIFLDVFFDTYEIFLEICIKAIELCPDYNFLQDITEKHWVEHIELPYDFAEKIFKFNLFNFCVNVKKTNPIILDINQILYTVMNEKGEYINYLK